jgi:hypothetical protein
MVRLYHYKTKGLPPQYVSIIAGAKEKRREERRETGYELDIVTR